MTKLAKACRDTAIGLIGALVGLAMFGGSAVCLAAALILGNWWWAAVGVALMFLFLVTLEMLT